MTRHEVVVWFQILHCGKYSNVATDYLSSVLIDNQHQAGYNIDQNWKGYNYLMTLSQYIGYIFIVIFFYFCYNPGAKEIQLNSENIFSILI